MSRADNSRSDYFNASFRSLLLVSVPIHRLDTGSRLDDMNVTIMCVAKTNGSFS